MWITILVIITAFLLGWSLGRWGRQFEIVLALNRSREVYQKRSERQDQSPVTNAFWGGMVLGFDFALSITKGETDAAPRE